MPLTNNYWLGTAGGGSMNTAAYWSLNRVPVLGTDQAVIDDSHPGYLGPANGGTCNANVLIPTTTGGAGLGYGTINGAFDCEGSVMVSGGTLTVNGPVTVANSTGALSCAANLANKLQLNGNVTLNGQINVANVSGAQTLTINGNLAFSSDGNGFGTIGTSYMFSGGLFSIVVNGNVSIDLSNFSTGVVPFDNGGGATTVTGCLTLNMVHNVDADPGAISNGPTSFARVSLDNGVTVLWPAGTDPAAYAAGVAAGKSFAGSFAHLWTGIA